MSPDIPCNTFRRRGNPNFGGRGVVVGLVPWHGSVAKKMIITGSAILERLTKQKEYNRLQ
jgi:hypothetical protein